MPQDFDDCRNNGGRIRTIVPKEGVYLHICYDKSGKSHAGEIHHIGDKGNSVKPIERKKTTKMCQGKTLSGSPCNNHPGRGKTCCWRHQSTS